MMNQVELEKSKNTKYIFRKNGLNQSAALVGNNRVYI